MTKLRGLTEVVIWVHNMEKSLGFYRDTLGLEVMSPPDSRGAIFLRVGDGVGTVPQQPVLVPLPSGSPEFPTDRSKRTMHHLGMEVPAEEFDREAERLRGLGLDVRLGEHPFLPVRGLYIDDPDGNEVELIATKV
jgi:catechol 2,3-dioxygenase